MVAPSPAVLTEHPSNRLGRPDAIRCHPARCSSVTDQTSVVKPGRYREVASQRSVELDREGLLRPASLKSRSRRFAASATRTSAGDALQHLELVDELVLPITVRPAGYRPTASLCLPTAGVRVTELRGEGVLPPEPLFGVDRYGPDSVSRLHRCSG